MLNLKFRDHFVLNNGFYKAHRWVLGVVDKISSLLLMVLWFWVWVGIERRRDELQMGFLYLFLRCADDGMISEFTLKFYYSYYLVFVMYLSVKLGHSCF